MANEKVMNTRLLLKYDSLAAWQGSDFNKALFHEETLLIPTTLLGDWHYY